MSVCMYLFVVGGRGLRMSYGFRLGSVQKEKGVRNKLLFNAAHPYRLFDFNELRTKTCT